MSNLINSSRRITGSSLRMDGELHPGWIPGTERNVEPGESVLCTGGPARVVKVLGKTSDGSRLLELQLHEGKHPPFFACASNVLVAPAAD